jgi:hypothetical protein
MPHAHMNGEKSNDPCWAYRGFPPTSPTRHREPTMAWGAAPSMMHCIPPLWHSRPFLDGTLRQAPM